MFTLTVALLQQLMPHCTNPAAWVQAFNQAMPAYGLDTQQRVLYFLANVAHESKELTDLRENMHYSAPRLRAVWPSRFTSDAMAARYAAAGPKAIASYVYANRLGNGDERTGDGWTFRGGGPNGLTFHDNYAMCGKAIMDSSDALVTHPEFIEDPEFGAAAACWHWDMSGSNTLADKGDFDGCCDVLNIGHKTLTMGDSNGFADRAAYLARMQRLVA